MFVGLTVTILIIVNTVKEYNNNNIKLIKIISKTVHARDK